MIKNKKMTTAVLSALVVLGSVMPITGSAQSTQKAFSDVKKEYVSYDAIMSLTEREIIKGYPDGTFKPFAQISRAHMAKLLAEMLELDLENVTNPNFKDVPVDHPYYAHIAALENAGIVSGYIDGTFGPNNNLNRAQVAKIISEGFDFDQKPLVSTTFKDVKKDEAYAKYLQALIDQKITVGTTPTTYSPWLSVTRSQLASFLYRSDSAINGTFNSAVVTEVKGDKLVTDEGTFEVSSSLSGLFSVNNQAAMKNAQIEFRTVNNKIVKIDQLVVNASGSASKSVVLDGAQNIVAGDLIINGDFVEVKGLVIKDDLTVSGEVQKSFTAKDVTIEGKTSIESSTQLSAVASLKDVAVITVNSTLNFDNVKLNVLDVAKRDSQLNFSNNSSVENMNIQQNVKVQATNAITIKNMNISGLVSELQLDAPVTNLTLNSATPLLMTGTGNITNIVLKSSEKVNLETTGTIKNLEVNKNASLQLGTSVKVDNIVLPDGVKADDIIANYDVVKGNIDNVNGHDNPDVTPPPSGGGGVVNPAPFLESAKLTFSGSSSNEKIATHVSGNVWEVSLSGLNDSDMFTGLYLNSSEAGKAKITFEVNGITKTIEKNLDASGVLNASVSTLLGLENDPQEDGISVGSLKALLGASGNTIPATLIDSTGLQTTITIKVTY